jgi:hypothetical protein
VGSEVLMDAHDREVWTWSLGGVAVMFLAPTAIGFVAYWFMRLFWFGWRLAEMM